MTDEMIAVIVIAAFMNPDIKKISIVGNFIGGTTGNTFLELAQANPFKIHELDLRGSV